MSTTCSCQPCHQAVRKSKGAGACEFTGENTFGRQTLCFTGIEAPGVAKVGFVKVGSVLPRVGASIWESCRQKAHEIVARARFALQNTKNKAVAFGALLEDESKKCARDYNRKKWGAQASRGFARWNLHCWLHQCWSIWCDTPALQVCNPARAKHIVTAACRKAVQMLRPSCYSELQLEVAKRIALAAGREDWEQVPQPRGSSVKSSSTKNVAHLSIHPPTHPSIIHTCIHVMSCHVMSCHVMSCHVMSCHVMSCHVIHWFVDSLIRWFVDLLIRWFFDSLIHWFTASLIHWFIFIASLIDSLTHWFSDLVIQWFFD